MSGRITRKRNTPRRENGGPQRDIVEWLEAGNEGTASEIAAALGLSTKTVRGALKRLVEMRVAAIRREEPRAGSGPGNPVQMANVWGAADGRPAVSRMNLVAAALARRTPLEQAWSLRA